MSSCSTQRDYESDNYSFQNFIKNLGKTFVITTTIVICMVMRNKLISPDTSLFYLAIYILGTSLLFTMISATDHYVYSNIMLGVGLALGLQMASTPGGQLM